MMVNKDIEAVTEYPEGVRCRWFLPGDILHFIFNPKRFHLEPSFFNFSSNIFASDISRPNVDIAS